MIFRAEANPISPPSNLLPPQPISANIQPPQLNLTPAEPKTKGRARKRFTPNVLSTTLAANYTTPVSTNLQEIQHSQQQIPLGTSIILDYNGQPTTANLLPADATVSQFLSNGQQRLNENYSNSAYIASTQMLSNNVKKIQKRRNVALKNLPTSPQIQEVIQLVQTKNPSTIMDKMNDTIEQVVCQHARNSYDNQLGTQKKKTLTKKPISKGKYFIYFLILYF